MPIVYNVYCALKASQLAQVVKNLLANTGDVRDTDSIPGLGRSPGGGLGNPLQYSCLENPMDRGAWWAMVHRATKSWTQLKRLSMHACTMLLTLFIRMIDLMLSVLTAKKASNNAMKGCEEAFGGDKYISYLDCGDGTW